MRWSEIDTIPCPVAQAMAVIGDAWTILIIRDALRGATKFDEFQHSTRASRAVVADRLARLVEHGVIERVQYEAHPPRYDYRLTKRGRALQPVLMMLAHWSETQLPETDAPDRPPPHHLRPQLHARRHLLGMRRSCNAGNGHLRQAARPRLRDLKLF